MSVSLFCLCALAATCQAIKLPAHSRILFQGDSITDMNRGRTDDPNHILGHSYVFLIAARTSVAYPELRLEFINRGISGNKVSDLDARWEADAIHLKPTVLSIMIGINDVDSTESMSDFAAGYDKLLKRTEEALPDTKLVICEPFGLPTGWRKPKWDEFQPRLIAAQQIAKQMAHEHHAIFVPLQTVFDVACAHAPAEYWIWDSIHPTYSGQQLIADQWVRIVGRKNSWR